MPATVVTPDAWRATPAVAEDEGDTPLTPDEISRLTELRARRPLALVEHFDERELARLEFQRWLYVTGRRRP
jgi:hypothetical protein